jgi:hypothetical protein
MATTTLLGHYAPLTWMTFGLDYLLWGTDPRGYHLTNIALHGANAVLFYFVAAQLLDKAIASGAVARRVGAMAAALFFAVHPLRAESVGWLPERRGLLSGTLVLASVLFYLAATDEARRGRRWYLAASAGCYLLAFAAKASLMTLPAILAVLDLYPLRRLPGHPRAWLTGRARAVWVEKVPYLLIALVGAGIAYWAQARGAPPRYAALTDRLINTLYSLWFYVFKTAVPVHLSPLYEAPASLSFAEPRFLASALGAAGLTSVSILLCRRWPAGLAVWLSYTLALAPVLGMIPMGEQLTADRYSYLSCLGWALLVGGAACWVTEGGARHRLGRTAARVLSIGAAATFVGLAGLTWQQVQIWRDGLALWHHAVSIMPDCSLCHVNLGTLLYFRGSFEAAEMQFDQALALRPDRFYVHEYVGLALAHRGRFPEAIGHYRLVLSREPAAVSTRLNLAKAFRRMGRLPETVEQARELLRFNRPVGVIAEIGKSGGADGPVPRLALLEAYLALRQLDRVREQYELLRAQDRLLAEAVATAFVRPP